MNTELRILRFDLPGEWADGWLYKDHLIFWSRSGEMHYAPLGEIVKLVKTLTSPRLSVVSDYLVFRSDWKIGEQFKRLLEIPGIEQDFLADFTAQEIVIPLAGVTPIPIPSERIPGFALDAAIYGNRVYVGSTAGLFETRFNPDRPAESNPVVPQLDHRVNSVTAKYSAINCSAGDEGLWFSRIHFGDTDSWWDEKRQLKRMAEVSRGNSFANMNLLNYTDDAFPLFLRSETVKEAPHDRAMFDEWQITGYETPTNIGGITKSAVVGAKSASQSVGRNLTQDGDSGDIQVLGNSNHRLLVALQDSLRVVDISARRGREIEAKSDIAFHGLSAIHVNPYSILGTHAFGRGFLVELPNEVRLINSQGSYVLIDEPVARIRTFAHSRRHREVILLVRETGISLIGIYVMRDTKPGY
jgi:hypothetical protein